MRIAYLVNQYPQTSHSFIRREIRGLESAGHEVDRFTIRPSPALPDPADEEERGRTRSILAQGDMSLGFALLASALGSPIRFFQAVRLAVRLGRRSDRGLLVHFAYLAEACLLARWTQRVQWLHAHFGTNSAAVAALCREVGGPPFSFTTHGPVEFDRPEFIGLTEKIARASLVVAVSSFCRAQLFRWARFEDWPKVELIHCGISKEFIGEPQRDGLDGHLFACVARLDEQKGHFILLEAARRLARRGLDFRIELIGDGPFRKKLQARIDDSGLSARITITGWLSGSDVRDRLLRSRCLVLASFAEGLPVVIMEALALGRPVIATSVAGIPELVEHGTSGWLVPAGSVEALEAAMERALLADPAELERMGKAGAARVALEYDAATEAARLGTLIAERLSRQTDELPGSLPASAEIRLGR